MTFHALPIEIQHLIVHFAYGVRVKNHILTDIRVIMTFRRSIPEHFLDDRFRPASVNPYPLWPWNPFKKGMPYFPTEGLDPSFAPWTVFPCFCMSHITADGFRRMGTYRGHMFRRLRAFMRSSLKHWNFFVKSLWSREGLDDLTNYAKVSENYMINWIHQLESVRYVTASPF